MNKRSHSWFKLTLLLLMATALLALNGCEMIKNLDFPWEENAGVPTKTPVQPVATETQVPTPTQAPVDPTPTQVPRQTRLVLWLPPEFDPEEDNAAAALLKARLERFARNNRIEIDVRLKNPSGSSNVIESLIATNGAAPENLPAVVLLRKQDLDAAHARGLVYVNEALQTLSGDTDWYSFAREAVSHENTSFGIGLLGDPMILAYQSRLESIPENNWFALPKSPVRFGFAADDSQGRFMLLLYLASNGETRDAQNQLILQKEPLTQALQVLADMQSARNLSPAVLQMQTPSAVWQSFAAWNLETAAMPASVVLKALSGDTTGQPELLFTPVDFTLTESWTLALAHPDSAQQELGTKLIQDLTETNFLAKWSEALGYVPARPTALGAWTNVNLKPALERVMNIARLYPRDDTIISLGPILRNAALMIIRDGATVEEAVSQALEGIK
jgi:hypothetical protein